MEKNILFVLRYASYEKMLGDEKHRNDRFNNPISWDDTIFEENGIIILKYVVTISIIRFTAHLNIITQLILHNEIMDIHLFFLLNLILFGNIYKIYTTFAYIQLYSLIKSKLAFRIS